MAYVLVCVIAALYVPRLGVALYPSTTMPVLTVSTSYPNVGPEDIEENVTKPIETRLSAISGLESVNSESSRGESRVRLTFGYDVDLDEATNDVNEVLARLPSVLPDDCEAPILRKFNMNSRPIMSLIVRGDLPQHELKSIAEDTIGPLLERVEGVAQANVRGGAEKVVRVEAPENRLDAYGLTLPDVAAALARRNVQTSAGTVTEGGYDYQVYLNETISTVEDVRDTVVTRVAVPSAGSSPARVVAVRLGDVADVFEDWDDSGWRVYVDGVPGLYLQILNETDSNSATVAKAVREAIGEINGTLPSGVSIAVLSDNTTMITSTMDEVYNTAFQGAVLAMFAIFFFLRGIKSAVIIGLSMPISVLVTLLSMSLMDLTLNMMTMAGLILGIGDILDSSIVVLDNIHRYREKGERSAVAAILGSRQMITAITASMLTNLCVFVPILMYQAELEMLGQMFREMVITVVISLTVSLVVAVTLVPALCGSVIGLETRTQRPLKNRVLVALDGWAARAIAALEDGYVRSLRFALSNRFLVLSLVVALLAASVVQFRSLGISFSPQSSTDDEISISLTMPEGTDNEVTEATLFRAQEILREHAKGFETIILTVGSGNTGSVQVNLPDPEDQTMTPAEIKAKVKPLLDAIPGATFAFTAGRGFRRSSPIDVELASDDPAAVSAVAERIIEILKREVPGATDVTSDLANGNPQYTVSVDRERAAALGVSMQAIATELRAALTGSTATAMQTAEGEVSVVVSLPKGETATLSDLGAIRVQGASARVPLDNIARLVPSVAPRTITREEGKRVNHVTANLNDGYVISRVQPEVERAIADGLVLPASVTLSYGGESADVSEFGGVLWLVVAVAVFLVFAVMAAQFESLVDPFIIFLSIPLLSIGVVWIYTLTGQTFSLFSAVGVVALVGIVVNNGIVLVDYANGLMREKRTAIDACLEAGKSRLQPILMTTLTSVIGTVPMAFFPGEGVEMMQPIGLTIVGGLLSGAFLTLYVSPVVYSFLNKRRERRFDDPDALDNQMREFDSRERA